MFFETGQGVVEVKTAQDGSCGVCALEGGTSWHTPARPCFKTGMPYVYTPGQFLKHVRGQGLVDANEELGMSKLARALAQDDLPERIYGFTEKSLVIIEANTMKKWDLEAHALTDVPLGDIDGLLGVTNAGHVVWVSEGPTRVYCSLYREDRWVRAEHAIGHSIVNFEPEAVWTTPLEDLFVQLSVPYAILIDGTDKKRLLGFLSDGGFECVKDSDGEPLVLHARNYLERVGGVTYLCCAGGISPEDKAWAPVPLKYSARGRKRKVVSESEQE